MDDRYAFSREEELAFFDKNLAQLVHTTGKFEHLSTTLPDTEAIINNVPTEGIDPETIAITLGLKGAFSYIRQRNKLTFNDLLTINNLIQNGAVGAGQIRQQSVMVPLTTETWVPPIPNGTEERQKISQLIARPLSATERAIDLNLYLSRWQLFSDGNKRTALVAANQLLVAAGAGFLAIPTTKMHWYGSKLQKFELTGRDADVKAFLYENAIQGLPQNRVVE